MKYQLIHKDKVIKEETLGNPAATVVATEAVSKALENPEGTAILIREGRETIALPFKIIGFTIVGVAGFFVVKGMVKRTKENIEQEKQRKVNWDIDEDYYQWATRLRVALSKPPVLRFWGCNGDIEEIKNILNEIGTKQDFSNTVFMYKKLYKGKKAVAGGGLAVMLDSSGDLNKHLREVFSCHKKLNELFDILNDMQ